MSFYFNDTIVNFDEILIPSTPAEKEHHRVAIETSFVLFFNQFPVSEKCE